MSQLSSLLRELADALIECPQSGACTLKTPVPLLATQVEDLHRELRKLTVENDRLRAEVARLWRDTIHD